jgi:hypothetical protein
MREPAPFIWTHSCAHPPPRLAAGRRESALPTSGEGGRTTRSSLPIEWGGRLVAFKATSGVGGKRSA